MEISIMTHKPIKSGKANDLQNWIALIVDDQPDNLVVASVALSYRGVQVHTATNGEEGLKLLQSLRPTFILLDLSMPRMDGWEMFRRVRQTTEIASVPVIALTAHVMDGDEKRVLDAGFDGYITKPFDVTLLAEQIRQVMDRTKKAN